MPLGPLDLCRPYHPAGVRRLAHLQWGLAMTRVILAGKPNAFSGHALRLGVSRSLDNVLYVGKIRLGPQFYHLLCRLRPK